MNLTKVQQNILKLTKKAQIIKMEIHVHYYKNILTLNYRIQSTFNQKNNQTIDKYIFAITSKLIKDILYNSIFNTK